MSMSLAKGRRPPDLTEGRRFVNSRRVEKSELEFLFFLWGLVILSNAKDLFLLKGDSSLRPK